MLVINNFNLDSDAAEYDIVRCLLVNYKRYFQPIFDLEDNSTHHYELLLRKKDGSSAFSDIIEMEKNGLIHLLDKANIMHAINMVDKKESSIPIAVNISAKSFENDAFCNFIVRSASRMKHKGKLYIELTETCQVKNVEKLNKLFIQLKKYDVFIAADDFSSGYMDEKSIMTLPFDNVKLDISLVQDLDNPKKRTRVKNILKYAKDNGISVTAECIENKKMLDQVNNLGVKLGQGYYLGMPQPKIKNNKILEL